MIFNFLISSDKYEFVKKNLNIRERVNYELGRHLVAKKKIIAREGRIILSNTFFSWIILIASMNFWQYMLRIRRLQNHQVEIVRQLIEY